MLGVRSNKGRRTPTVVLEGVGRLKGKNNGMLVRSTKNSRSSHLYRRRIRDIDGKGVGPGYDTTKTTSIEKLKRKSS